MKGADKVLSLGNIDRGLSANRRIDLRQQGRRNLRKLDAAFHYAIGKTDKISNDAPAERNHQGVAIDPEPNQLPAKLLEPGKRLGLFSRWKHDRVGIHLLPPERTDD